MYMIAPREEGENHFERPFNFNAGGFLDIRVDKDVAASRPRGEAHPGRCHEGGQSTRGSTGEGDHQRREHRLGIRVCPQPYQPRRHDQDCPAAGEGIV